MIQRWGRERVCIHTKPLLFDRSTTERCNDWVYNSTFFSRGGIALNQFFPFSCRFCKDVVHFEEK